MAGPAVEQLRRAALDAVDAARALLDAAESVIQDPAAIDAVVNTVGAITRTATEAVAGFVPKPAHGAHDADDAESGGGESGGRDGDFERIPVD